VFSSFEIIYKEFFRLPRHHVAHCDAIAQGYGDDGHAMALQRHGLKAQRFHKQL